MNELLPIIRRPRRPLLAAEAAAPVVVGHVEPVPTVAPEPVEPVLTEVQPQMSDAKVTSKRSAR